MSVPLTVIDGIAAGLPLANIDTDMMLPSRFLKTTRRSGLGIALFDALRFDADGAERPDFVLNRPPWREASFLVTLDNCGSGSSREHAPWALLDFGIRCIIAPSFADIFANNCLKNGILCLKLDRERCDRLLRDASRADSARLHLDLPNQTLKTADGETIYFDLPAEWKARLIEGRDDIVETMRFVTAIASHDAGITYPRQYVPTELHDLRLVQTPPRSGEVGS